VLGLYISAAPAANLLDLIFLDRFAFYQRTSQGEAARWIVLVLGITRFIGRLHIG
jgi:hypothetical protein